MFAGVTVIVALLALNVTGVGFLGLMGTVGAVAVLVAILMAVTLTPAILSLVGMRILRRRERERLAAGERTHDDEITDRDRPMSTTRAWTVLGLGVAGLLVVAAPATQMRLGLPDGSTQPPDSAGYQAYEVQAEKFGDGSNGPLLVVADLPGAVAEDDVLSPSRPPSGEASSARSGTSRRSCPSARRRTGRRWRSRSSPTAHRPASRPQELVHEPADADPADGLRRRGHPRRGRQRQRRHRHLRAALRRAADLPRAGRRALRC